MSGNFREVRLSKCSVSSEEKAAVARVLDSEYLGMGGEVKNFENEIQNFLETKRSVVCVNTGTSALHLSLMGLDIGPGDEVLVPSITYVASFQAITATGAKAVACDVIYPSGLIDLEDARKRVNSKTKAIMPVHYASQTQGIEEVYSFAKEFNLRVVEDAAHAFGNRHEGKRVGSFGDIQCFSFDGIKNITSGEGGAIVSGDLAFIQRVQDARLLGVEKDTEKRFSKSRSWVFNVKHQGFRFHMSDILAAIGREQLKKIEKFSQKRRSSALRYRDLLQGVAGIELINSDFENIVPHVFVVLVKNRDQLVVALKEKGIATGIHYYPNHLLDFFKTDYELNNAERFARECLTLPLHVDLSDDDISYVCSELKSLI